MRGIHTCCPEAPSTINITQNIIEMDGETAFFVDERFTGAEAPTGVITLDYTPYAAASVQVSLNSGVQRPVNDYVVVGKQVRLNFIPETTDKIHVRYFSKESGAAVVPGGSELPTGFTMGYNGIGEAPDGWLYLDGVQTVTAAHEDLFAYLVANTHLLTDYTPGDTTLTLRNIQTPYYDAESGTMQVGKTIIKT